MIKYWLAICALFAGCSVEEPGAKALTVGTSPAYFPYEFKNEEGRLDGFDMDLAAALAKKINRPLVFKEMDFDALIISLAQGKIDAIISGLSITDSREMAVAIIPYQTTPTDHLTLVFWESIPATISTIAVQEGTFQADFLRTQNLQMKTLQNNTDLLIDIKFRKSSAALMEPLIARALAKKMPQLQLQDIPLSKESHARGMGIGINKKNKALIHETQEAIEHLRKDKTLASLEQKWFGENL